MFTYVPAAYWWWIVFENTPNEGRLKNSAGSKSEGLGTEITAPLYNFIDFYSTLWFLDFNSMI